MALELSESAMEEIIPKHLEIIEDGTDYEILTGYGWPVSAWREGVHCFPNFRMSTYTAPTGAAPLHS